MQTPYFEIVSLNQIPEHADRRSCGFALPEGQIIQHFPLELFTVNNIGKVGYIIDEDQQYRRTTRMGYESVAMAGLLGYFTDIDYVMFIFGQGASSISQQAASMGGRLIYDYSGVFDDQAQLKRRNFKIVQDSRYEIPTPAYRYIAPISDELALLRAAVSLIAYDNEFVEFLDYWRIQWLKTTQIGKRAVDRDLLKLFSTPEEFPQYNNPNLLDSPICEVGCHIGIVAQKYLNAEEWDLLNRIITEPHLIATWAVNNTNIILAEEAIAANPLTSQCQDLLNTIAKIRDVWKAVLANSCSIYTKNPNKANELYAEVISRKEQTIANGSAPGPAILTSLGEILGIDIAYAAREQGVSLDYL